MSNGHTKKVCSCGALISQCRCMSHDKQVEIVQKGCKRCRGEASGAIPSESISGDTMVDATLVSAPAHEVTINVVPLVVPDASPPLAAWQLSVETARTEWKETFGSRDLVDAFIRGVRAGAAARGCFDVEVVE